MNLRKNVIRSVLRGARPLFASRRLGIAGRRVLLATLTAGARAPKGTRFQRVSIAGVPVQRVQPPHAATSGTLIYLHGGAYALGSARGYRGLAAQLAAAAGMTALVPDYTRAPHAHYPVALEEMAAVYTRLLDDGLDPKTTVIAGDSAGGGLTLALAMALRDRGIQAPAALGLICPWADLAVDIEATRPALRDPLILPSMCTEWAPRYVGSGVIEEVGAGVTRVKPGDHVVCSFIPNCGTCRYCCTGRQNLCDMGATILEGCMPDGSFRFHSQGTDFGAMCMLGTFAERATVSQHSVVKVDDWLPLETAVLVGCGVPSGWGTAVNAGNLRAGDTAVIYGVGGLGINAVQGATAAGCKYVVVVDPVAFKRETALKFGATHAFADAASAAAKVDELTWGQGADAALILVGTVDDEVVSAATAVIGKGGTVVITGLADPAKLTVHVSGTDLTLHEKTIKGSLFGSCNPQYDIVRLLRLYDAGQLMLDELVTTTYNLEQVNQGYQDLRDGKNIRGVIVH